jgi:hypothetical protein
VEPSCWGGPLEEESGLWGSESEWQVGRAQDKHTWEAEEGACKEVFHDPIVVAMPGGA